MQQSSGRRAPSAASVRSDGECDPEFAYIRAVMMHFVEQHDGAVGW